MRIDIYCRVVDNFGDAGVCWRLARQLADEFGVRVRLSCDRPELVVRLASGRFDAGLELWTRASSPPGTAASDGVTLQHWPDDEALATDADDMPDAVIAAFQCDLPAALRTRLRRPAADQPLWINLDYLSAEHWVTQVHGHPSHKPAGGIEWFFMPGFDETSGGLIRERNAILDETGRPFALPGRRAQALAVSVFCYPQAPLQALCAALARAGRPVDLYVAAGVPAPEKHETLGPPGSPESLGSLAVHRLPWLSQPQFDAMLRACDLNFVRGEDSWLRAIWAGKPFVWMPYRQQQQAHRAKLQAFLERLAPAFDPAAFVPVRALAEAWNGIGIDDAAAIGAALSGLWSMQDDIAAGFVRFRAQLSRQSDLATRLIEFVRAHRPLL